MINVSCLGVIHASQRAPFALLGSFTAFLTILSWSMRSSDSYLPNNHVQVQFHRAPVTTYLCSCPCRIIVISALSNWEKRSFPSPTFSTAMPPEQVPLCQAVASAKERSGVRNSTTPSYILITSGRPLLWANCRKDWFNQGPYFW